MLLEHQQLARAGWAIPSRAERQGRALIPAHVQAEHTTVEGQGTLEISDSEAYTPDVGASRKRGHVVIGGLDRPSAQPFFAGSHLQEVRPTR